MEGEPKAISTLKEDGLFVENGMKHAKVEMCSAWSAVDESITENVRSLSNSLLAKPVLRKIDLWMIPLMFITYNLNYMDKTLLSSAAVFGLKKSTHLTGDEYNWVSSIFYFGYLFWEYPTTIIIQRLPVGKYVSANTLVWGAVVALTAACTNYGGLITVRWFLGMTEATISAAFLYITSMWYTRTEVPSRLGLWFAGNAFGGMLSGPIAYGLGHIEHPLAPWRWMFIVLGIATFLWGFVLLFLLPDTINSAWFLTPEERICAEERIIIHGTGKVRHSWKPGQTLECLLDPKTYFFFAISFLTQIPQGGTQTFGNLVLQGFGFTSLQTTLMTIPAHFIPFVTIIGTGWAAGKWRNINLYLICLVVLPAITGAAIVYAQGPSKGVKLLGYYLLTPGSAALPLAMSLIGVDFKGSTKKLTMTAVLFLAYCAGSIAGPQFFKPDQAPHYDIAFRAILICYILVLILAMVLRAYLMFENRRRDRLEGTTKDWHKSSVVHVENTGDDELTDWNMPGFRYHM